MLELRNYQWNNGRRLLGRMFSMDLYSSFYFKSMSKILENKFIVVTFIGLLTFTTSFLWYDIRPSFIVKSCYRIAARAYTPGRLVGRMAHFNEDNKDRLQYDHTTFNNCILKNGLQQ